MGIMRNCREVARLLSQAEEMRLSWRERWAVCMHRLFCMYCRRYGRQIVLLRRMMREGRPHGGISSQLGVPARDCIRAALNKAQQER